MEAKSPLDWLDDDSRRRSAAGLHRVLRPRDPAAPLLDLASNDYLGLSCHQEVIAGARRSLERCGAGSTGSRLVTGTLDEHEALERELAAFCGQPSALVFSSGYMANLGLVTALSGRGALVVSDAGSHASLVDACRLSRARVVVTPRGDVDAVAEALSSRIEQRAVVLTDSVYSADGTLAPVAALHGVAREHGAVLVVDEAHGLGVRGSGGRGFVHELRLAGQEDLVVTATLSKALGAQGGVVFGSPRVRAHLVDTARSFIFDTALAPPMVGAARAALGIVEREPDRAARVLGVAKQLAEATGAIEPESAVVSVILGDPERAVAARDAARERGLEVGCFRPPSVPAGTSRLRLTARADLSDADVSRAEAILRDVVEEFSHL
ncbi:8-amino-7-oxononanoate synthase [Corynebacterium sanguinis]|uniref:8-amino-7-oxononanoate synthase n=2 Tax=Corynebacterium sanguinis TaxID=2594913 RepID=A0A6C1TVH3_9CORY|nr:8-amino-7-oxononanoate synthase [Corynebacterium sanguinis]MCT2023620.1 8-amino-7-oxononanoate synthase [Corynebacterium sanguinis]QDR77664.1 8-amino-7-oxononanoate synthase [Corynebacterium sanguinis]TVS27243.1 8-amino-7-oxononanoate synthase [Corynebacterium sanguinis]